MSQVTRTYFTKVALSYPLTGACNKFDTVSRVETPPGSISVPIEPIGSLPMPQVFGSDPYAWTTANAIGLGYVAFNSSSTLLCRGVAISVNFERVGTVYNPVDKRSYDDFLDQPIRKRASGVGTVSLITIRSLNFTVNFTYPMRIETVSPSQINQNGSASIAIFGDGNFLQIMSYEMKVSNGVAPTTCNYVSTNQLLCNAPAVTSWGLKNVTIRASGQSWTYESPNITLNYVNPNDASFTSISCQINRCQLLLPPALWPPCATAVACDTATLLCRYTFAADNTDCSNSSDPCNPKSCVGGMCQATNQMMCPETSNPCSQGCFNVFNTTKGWTKQCGPPIGSSCDDGNRCTDNDVCNIRKQCVGVAKNCTGGNCTQCDQADGICKAVPNGSICNDGIFCNGASDSCQNGVCTPGGNPCAGLPECTRYCNETLQRCMDPDNTVCDSANNGVCLTHKCKSGICTTIINNGTSCDDGNSCTVGDRCNAIGNCMGTRNCVATCGVPADCAVLNRCEYADCINNVCVFFNKTGGSSCADSTYCNGNETCDGMGQCLPGIDPCFNLTVCQQCNELNKTCVSPKNTSCDDGIYCNGLDRCDGFGLCIHLGVNCDANTGADRCGRTCNEVTKTCVAADGYACDDAFWCNGHEYCVSGMCTGVSEPPCLSSNPCNNTCNEKRANCAAPDRMDCSGTDFCDSISVCNAGVCQTAVERCENSGPCGSTCNSVTRSCSYKVNSACTRDQSDAGYCLGNGICNINGQCVADGIDPCLGLGQENGCSFVCKNETRFAQGTPSTGTCQLDSVCVANLQADEERTTSIIAGSVAGGVVICLCVLLIVIFLVLRRRKQQHKTGQLNQSAIIELEDRKVETNILDLTNIKIGQKLGGGQFGEVFHGTWNGETEVALKRVKDKSQMEAFLKEAQILALLQHPNVLHLYGLYTSSTDDKFMVVEYLNKGSLYTLLKSSGESFKVERLLRFIAQCAAGLVYMHEKRIVHKDISARNVLVAETDGKLMCRISDFGLSEQLAEGQNECTALRSDFAVKWSAIEILKGGNFSFKSDIWSFGILAWEILERGAAPFFWMNNQQASEAIQNGERCPMPEGCPEQLYKLMIKCWHVEPQQRPSFPEILKEVQTITNSISDSNSHFTPNVNSVGPTEGTYTNDSLYNT